MSVMSFVFVQEDGLALFQAVGVVPVAHMMIRAA
jgi:hypothetical protein